jgi:hypothetical protein
MYDLFISHTTLRVKICIVWGIMKYLLPYKVYKLVQELSLEAPKASTFWQATYHSLLFLQKAAYDMRIAHLYAASNEGWTLEKIDQ